MANPLRLLSKLRRFDASTPVEKYLTTEMRQNLKAIEDAFRKLGVDVSGINEDIGGINTELETAAPLYEQTTNWVSQGVTSITASTTNPGKGSAVYDRVYTRFDGPDLLLRVDYYQNSGGTAGSGDYFINLPSGIGTINTAITGTYTGTSANIGEAVANVGKMILTNGVSSYICSGVVYDSTRIRVMGIDGLVAAAIWGSGAKAFTASDLRFSGLFRLPLTERS